jgi:acylphosphatase
MPESEKIFISLCIFAFIGVLVVNWDAEAYRYTRRRETSAMGSYGTFRYEIHGKVQGVYFRKYTADTAKGLGLVGWVMNTAQGTVVGEAQGPASELLKLRKWLEKTGSPKSKIQKAVFKDERAGLSESDLAFKTFEIRKNSRS